MTDTFLQKAQFGSIVSLQLNAPTRRNALSYAMLDELSHALESVSDDVVGIVISGAGADFSAGADFNDLCGTKQDIEFDNRLEKIAHQILSSPVPVVAAVEGVCMGAAVHLALVCDARFAGLGSRVKVPAVRLGLLYNPQAIAWLSSVYPRDAVRRLLTFGEEFNAEQAQRAGFFSEVVPQGSAFEAALAAVSATALEHRDALMSTRQLLSELETGQYDYEKWEVRRRELLTSPARHEAVRQAKKRHT